MLEFIRPRHFIIKRQRKCIAIWKVQRARIQTHTYRDGLHVALHVCLNVAKPFALLGRHIVVGRRRRCRQCRTDCLCACFAI